MGLDNGLILYSKKEINIPKELKSFVARTINEDWDYSCEYDLLYFRKCYNIRRAVGRVLEADLEYCGKSGLTISEVKGIWWVLNIFNNESTWEESEWGSIWTYDEIRDRLDQSLLILEWLINFMRENQDDSTYVVEFYDSY